MPLYEVKERIVLVKVIRAPDRDTARSWFSDVAANTIRGKVTARRLSAEETEQYEEAHNL